MHCQLRVVPTNERTLHLDVTQGYTPRRRKIPRTIQVRPRSISHSRWAVKPSFTGSTFSSLRFWAKVHPCSPAHCISFTDKHPFLSFIRVCAGSHIAISSLWLAIATMLSTFEFSQAIDKAGMPIEAEIKYETGLISYVWLVARRGFSFLMT